MKLHCKLLIQLFLLLISINVTTGQAQLLDRQLIVRWESKVARQKAAPEGGVVGRWLAEPLLIELLTYPDPASCVRARKRFTNHWAVRSAEMNRAVHFRADPNDPAFDQQRDNFARAGFRAAWNLTAGGQTVDQQQIVVAVLDAGFDVDHEDLAPNLWNNPHEVLGDGIDNDGNGYVDDQHGWDLTGDDPELAQNTHGTQVIGLLGAKGNNGIGVAGTNWDLKMMLFSIQNSAHIIEAYEYIREQRRRYNATAGAEGAFVVATNASFGVEGGTCADFQTWGDLYDELGRVGILTAASTANRHWDVDTFGDMPTDCPSDYLIGVANVGENNVLWRSSGFGQESVDLGAPGEMSYSTFPNNRYAAFGSTSAAAPYVTGAIALLYATPCPALLEKVKADPASAALLIRQTILSSTRPSLSLQSRTATGGTLDVGEAQRTLSLICSAAGGEQLTISRVVPNPARDFVVLETNALVFSESARVELYDLLGRRVSSQLAKPISGNTISVRIGLRGVAAGTYLVRLTERDRVAEARLLVF